jgi:hypothetical protein
MSAVEDAVIGDDVILPGALSTRLSPVVLPAVSSLTGRSRDGPSRRFLGWPGLLRVVRTSNLGMYMALRRRERERIGCVAGCARDGPR